MQWILEQRRSVSHPISALLRDRTACRGLALSTAVSAVLSDKRRNHPGVSSTYLRNTISSSTVWDGATCRLTPCARSWEDGRLKPLAIEEVPLDGLDVAMSDQIAARTGGPVVYRTPERNSIVQQLSQAGTGKAKKRRSHR
jgi:hypothetical protein